MPILKRAFLFSTDFFYCNQIKKKKKILYFDLCVLIHFYGFAGASRSNFLTDIVTNQYDVFSIALEIAIINESKTIFITFLQNPQTSDYFQSENPFGLLFPIGLIFRLFLSRWQNIINTSLKTGIDFVQKNVK